jgi:nicotinamidase-related amidase
MEPAGEGQYVQEQYILITQCLQNDFFLNLDCQLSLPESAVSKLLLDREGGEALRTEGHRRVLPEAELRHSPLARFLDATVGSRMRGHGDGVLHLINVRDWHVPGEAYDLERRQYGAHCEADTWGAAYLDGLTDLLAPEPPPGGAADDWGGRLRVHHVRSNTLYDFQDTPAHPPGPGHREASPLAALLDELLADGRHETTHVVVVGVLTDIKIQLLLTGIRSRYDVRQLVVSDALTASRTLERHLTALDFCQRVLRTEVMTGLAELARFLGSRPDDDRRLTRGGGGDAEFAGYSSYIQDKQGILSYEDARLRDYRIQTSERLRQAQRTVGFAAKFLLGLGTCLLLTALLLSLLGVVFPGRVGWQSPAVLGALGAGQIVTLFFTRPVRSVQDALAEETIYRMVLESRSLKVALARYHVTTANALRRHDDFGSQSDALERQLEVLEKIDAADFERLKGLGVTPRSDQSGGPGTRPRRARRAGMR